MFKAKVTSEPHGAQLLLTISGNPEDVSQTVCTFVNHGMFKSAAVPEIYLENPLKFSRVTVAATKKGVRPAIMEIARFEMSNSPEMAHYRAACKGKDGGIFLKLVEARANALESDIKHEEQKTLADEIQGNRSDYSDIHPEDDTAAFRSLSRRVLSTLNGNHRQRANGKGGEE